MSVTIIRSLLTVVMFAAFVALWFWAWSKDRKADFDAAARLPLESDDPIEARGDRS